MFPKMRRNQQQLSLNETLQHLEESNCGVLSLCGDDGYPYGVPLNHVYTDGKLYFHCGKIGHKIDLISQNSKACYTVILQGDVIPETFSTRFISIVVFGQIRLLQSDDEKRHAIELLAEHLSPGEDLVIARKNEIESSWSALCMLEMTLEHVTGKRSKA